LIDEGEIEPVLSPVEIDRRDEARLRAISTKLSFVGETSPRPAEASSPLKVSGAGEACAGEVEATDGALSKILRAEEAGDPVSDLYEAAATIEGVVSEPAADTALECWEDAVKSGSVDSELRLNAPRFLKESRMMT